MISIKTIRAKETYAIRKEVLRKNIDLPYVFKGDDDHDSMHFGAYEKNQLVGVLSLMKKSHPSIDDNLVQYQLRGMALLKTHQKKGYGKDLVLHAKNELNKKGIQIMWCNARIGVINFYLRCGFIEKSDAFMVKKIGLHKVMVSNLVKK